MITLDRLTHTYYDGQTPLDWPTVTEVCGMFGRDYSSINPWYSERGIAVHAGCALLNQELLDWTTVDPEIEPYLKSYAQWLENWLPLVWEYPLKSTKHRFTGTFDLIAEKDSEIVLIDLKTSKSVDPAVELQLDGQQILVFENTKYVPDACAYLQLKGDGSEAEFRYVNTGDFLAALEMYRWKQSHSRKKKI